MALDVAWQTGKTPCFRWSLIKYDNGLYKEGYSEWEERQINGTYKTRKIKDELLSWINAWKKKHLQDTDALNLLDSLQ